MSVPMLKGNGKARSGIDEDDEGSEEYGTMYAPEQLLFCFVRHDFWHAR
jgi:hypothetical protein